MNVGDIVLVDNQKPAIITHISILYGSDDPGYMVSFFGNKESAWYNSGKDISLHIPSEDRSISEMKELLYILKALS